MMLNRIWGLGLRVWVCSAVLVDDAEQYLGFRVRVQVFIRQFWLMNFRT